MRIVVIREDALDAIRDRAILPLQEQVQAGETEIRGRKTKLFIIEIDTDVEAYIKSNGIDIDDIDEVSDFIVSALSHKH